jgi:hypothetical protein
MSGRHVPNGEYQKVYSSRFIAGCFRHCTSTQCFVGTSANGPTAPARHSRLEARATQTWQVDSRVLHGMIPHRLQREQGPEVLEMTTIGLL